MVFSGLRTACRLASCPTNRSPALVKATTDGVNRLPSLLITTVGLPPSITATTELVVPKSIPTAFAIAGSLSQVRCTATRTFGATQRTYPKNGLAYVAVFPWNDDVDG